MMAMSRRAEATAVVVGFTALAIASTYPRIRLITNHLPSDLGDPLLTAWTLAWDADRIRRGLSGLWDAPSFFPYQHTLLYSDHLLGVAMFSAPLQWLTGNPLLVYNVAFVASSVLSGGGMYLLARELTGRRDAALVAGVIYACQPFRASHFPHLQWQLTGWLPLSLWALHLYFRTVRARWLVWTAVFYLLQCLTAAYFTYFALVALVPVALVEWWRARLPIGKVLRQAALPVVLIFVVMLPIVRAYYEVREASGLHRTPKDIVELSADV